MKTWFKVQNAVGEDTTTARIDIIDFIGDWWDDAMNRYWGENIGVTAKAFVEQLAALPQAVKAIHVHINSPGGDVQAAVNIANALREQTTSKGRTVETFIDGIAASAASIIAMAGSKVHMADNALLMIHEPYMVSVGNAAEMRKAADVLDTIRGQIVATYKWHATIEDSEIEALIAAETWMDAATAVEKGFATDVVAGLSIAAALPPQAIAKLQIPAAYRERVSAFLEKPKAPAAAASATEVLRLCKADNCLDLAESLIESQATTEQVKAAITRTKSERSAAAARAAEIRAACATAKLPELAEGYIAGAMTLDAVKAQLTLVTARLDKVEIDGALPPGGGDGVKARAALNPTDVYAARRTQAQGAKKE